eukprot:gene5911-6152_t
MTGSGPQVAGRVTGGAGRATGTAKTAAAGIDDWRMAAGIAAESGTETETGTGRGPGTVAGSATVVVAALHLPAVALLVMVPALDQRVWVLLVFITLQAEQDVLAAELQDIKSQFARSETLLQRTSAAYAAKAQGVLNMRAVLRSWYTWREYAARKRRLARLAVRAEEWHVQRWLLGRAWDRWLLLALNKSAFSVNPKDVPAKVGWFRTGSL